MLSTLKWIVSAVAVSVILTQAIGAPAVAQSASAEANIQRVMRKAERHAATVQTRAITEVRGEFRVRGKLTNKSDIVGTCTCTASFGHFTADSEFYTNTGTEAIVDGKCNIDIPFRWPRADDSRPVFGSVNVFCQPDVAAGIRDTGGPGARLFFQDLPEIPAPVSGKGELFTFFGDY